jgi:hypothetical protein
VPTVAFVHSDDVCARSVLCECAAQHLAIAASLDKVVAMPPVRGVADTAKADPQEVWQGIS